MPTPLPPVRDPIRFHPIYQQRVWGGHHLATRLGRTLPAHALPCGESWEIVDRPEAASVVLTGPWAGHTLSTLWSDHREEIFGFPAHPGRFPILCKVLDARDRLSVQVHPPADAARDLGGEPKDEMWYVLDADPEARLYVGLTSGVTTDTLASAIESGQLEPLLNTLPARPGESIFLPSGRIHAIGAGFLLLEIQQNSDTTYRVHDWGRSGLDGKPRTLHIPEAIASTRIDPAPPAMRPAGDGILVSCPHFEIRRLTLVPGNPATLTDDGCFRLVAVAGGTVTCGSEAFHPGDFFLLPRHGAPLDPGASMATVLVTSLPASPAG